MSDTASDIFVSQTMGRNGRAGLRLTTGNAQVGSRASVRKYFTTDLESVIVGSAIRIDSSIDSLTTAQGQGLTKPIFSFLDGSQYQCSLVISPSMRVVTKKGRPDNGTQIARTSDFYLKENVFYYIEAMVTISPTGGIFRVFVDGVERLPSTNVDTRATTNNFTNGVEFGFPGGTTGQARYIRFDDMYIIDPSSGLNARLGDVVVDGLAANADWNTNWTKSGSGTLRYEMIDDSVPDNELTYNYTTQPGNLDAYSLESYHFTSGSVWGMASNIYARKNDAGIVRVQPFYTSAAGTAVGADKYLNMSWSYHTDYTEQNPLTATNWNTTNVPSALKFGYKKV